MKKVHFLWNLGLFMRKEDEVHYIGGAEILPPPLEGEQGSILYPDARWCACRAGEKGADRTQPAAGCIHSKKFDNTGVGVEDLISIGTIGLIKGINTFNRTKILNWPLTHRLH